MRPEEPAHLRAEVMPEPMDRMYGVRDRAFRDPSGNHLRFSAPLKS